MRCSAVPRARPHGRTLRPQRAAPAPVSRRHAPRATADGADSPDTSSSQPPPRRLPASRVARFLLTLPLELSAAGAKTNDHYLARRARKHWWSADGRRTRGGEEEEEEAGAAPAPPTPPIKQHAFPRVPADSLPALAAEIESAGVAASLWAKALPLGAIFFAASFNLTILQSLKDALVVTAAGAEALPFLASLGVLPASLAFFFYHKRVAARLPPVAGFAAALAPLVCFFAFFALVLHPMAPALHPAGGLPALTAALPSGLAGLVRVLEHWTYSLFFCAAELWGGVAISVLFWGLANDVCTVNDAKALYPLMGVAANVALVVAGSYVKAVNAAAAAVGGGGEAFALKALVGTVCALTAAMIGLRAWVAARVPAPPPDPARAAKDAEKKAAKAAAKAAGAGGAFAALRASPTVANLALLVVGYGVAHRLFEFAWKGALRAHAPSALAYQGVLADVSIATGWATIAAMLGGRFVFQVLGWRVAAAATPAVMAVTGGAFFGLSLAAANGGGGWSVAGLAPAAAGVAAGAVTQVFARAAKFSLFDPAKEMVYIEMDADEKAAGKPAVDLVGSQVGKSGAAWTTQALLLATGSLAAALPFLAAAYAVVLVAWLRAVGVLGALMADHDRKDEAEEAAAAAAKRAAAEAAAAAAERDAAAAAAGLPPPPPPIVADDAPPAVPRRVVVPRAA